MIKAGWLQKESTGIVKKWNERYVILTKESLAWHETTNVQKIQITNIKKNKFNCVGRLILKKIREFYFF